MSRKRDEFIPLGDVAETVELSGDRALASRAGAPRARRHFTRLDQVAQLVGVASLDLDRLVEPGDGFGGIRRHTAPLCIHDPEPVLCVGVPLLRGLTEPSDGGNVIPLYAEPFCVPHPDGVLRRSVTLLDRLSVQLAIQGPFAEPGASGDSEDQKAAGREQGHLDNVRSKWPGGGASGE